MIISVITVVRNGVQTIGRCIDSVRAQKGVEIEYIIIDGASNDGTLDVLKSRSKDINSLISENDYGIYDAMNKGLRLARGDIISILNADDIFAHDQVLMNIQKNFIQLNLDALYGDLEYFKVGHPFNAVRTYRSNRFRPEQLSCGWMPAHPTLFLHRRVYDAYGFFDPSYKIAGDFELICRIFKEGKLRSLYMPEVLVRMQLGGISTSGLKSTCLLLQENLRACKKNNIQSNYIKLMTRYPRKILEYLL